MPHRPLIQLIKEVDPTSLESFLKRKIAMENRILETHATLGNEMECLRAKHRIADAKIISLIASGDLTL